MNAEAGGAMKRSGIFLIPVILLLCNTISMSQTTNSSLVGTVTDASGSAVPGATIRLKNADTGLERTAETTATGSYRLFPVNPGDYELRAEKTGFAAKVQSRVVVGVAEAVKVDFELKVGDVSTSVDVSDVAPLLQTQETSVGGTITGAELRPLVTRHIPASGILRIATRNVRGLKTPERSSAPQRS
jgi:hypothetical protein